MWIGILIQNHKVENLLTFWTWIVSKVDTIGSYLKPGQVSHLGVPPGAPGWHGEAPLVRSDWHRSAVFHSFRDVVSGEMEIVLLNVSSIMLSSSVDHHYIINIIRYQQKLFVCVYNFVLLYKNLFQFVSLAKSQKRLVRSGLFWSWISCGRLKRWE